MTSSPQRHPSPTLVFLDRDGTIIRDEQYLSRPEDVKLLDGAADAIAQLNHMRIPVVIVTNQSGIGRGYYTQDDYERTAARLDELLAQHGAHIDASYHCPHAPEAQCACRKPKDELFREAIREHHFDATFPLLIGDRWRDIAPARALNGMGILVPSLSTPDDDIARAQEDAYVTPSLSAALRHVFPHISTHTSPSPSTSAPNTLKSPQ